MSQATIDALQKLIDAMKADQTAGIDPVVIAPIATAGAGAGLIDPIVPPGTPDTITMERTGHVLSRPRPDLGEMYMGYFGRVSLQTGGNAEQRFAAVYGSGPDGGVPDRWPELADKFSNPLKYMTAAERAAYDKSAAAWAAAAEKLKTHSQTPEASQQQEHVRKTKAEKKAERKALANGQATPPVDPNAVPIGGQT